MGWMRRVAAMLCVLGVVAGPPARAADAPATDGADVRSGRALLAADRYAEAEAAFRRAVKSEPDNERAWAGLATALSEQHDPRKEDEAATAYQMAAAAVARKRAQSAQAAAQKAREHAPAPAPGVVPAAAAAAAAAADKVAPPSAPALVPTTVVPGVARGRITRADGRPINLDGAEFTLTVPGVNVNGYTPTPNADGTWSTPLAGPNYYRQPYCQMKVPFDGDKFTYELVPSAKVPDTDFAKGIACDFVWKIDGPKPETNAHHDRGAPPACFGAGWTVTWITTYKDAQGVGRFRILPDGTKFVFRAEPKGKLIDGSDGKPLIWERAYDPKSPGRVSFGLDDVPPALGGWRLTGKEVLPGGVEKPLLLKPDDGSKLAGAVDLKVKSGGLYSFRHEFVDFAPATP